MVSYLLCFIDSCLIFLFDSCDDILDQHEHQLLHFAGDVIKGKKFISLAAIGIYTCDIKLVLS